jgi:hypothetical protein
MSDRFQHKDRWQPTEWQQNPHRFGRKERKGDRVWFGLAVIFAGVVIMLKKMHLIPNIEWDTIWPIILIAVGLFIGIQKRFANNAWWILVLFGTVYLIPEFKIAGARSSSLVLPLALIIGGLFMVFRSRKKKDCVAQMETVTNTGSALNLDLTFAGRKEIITSKEFKGGFISVTFGGAEVNMIQADNKTEPMVIDLKVSFGGVELIVPSHWEIRNEISPTFGGVEDHRSMLMAPPANEEKRVLILRGTCSFGSIEIKSY